MDVLDALAGRISVAALADPGPDAAQREAMLAAAMRAPDHGRMRPWRFVWVEGEGRRALGEAFAAAALANDPSADPSVLERERGKPLRAPLVLAVAATPRERRGVPEIEQVLSAGAAAQNVLLAAHAMGFGAIWRTGDAAYAPAVRAALGLAETDRIVAFLYIGTRRAAPEPPPPLPPGLVSLWTGAGGPTPG